MKEIRVVSILAVLSLGTACQQFAQQAVGPIPPSSIETQVRPLSPEEQQYYTLPQPVLEVHH